MRILLAPDKFKRSLTATEACLAIERGLREGWPGGSAPEFVHHPIADGGEGTTEAVITALGGEWVGAEVEDALHRPLRARYGWIREIPRGVDETSSAGATGAGIPLTAPVAVLEMSAASGLDLVCDLPLDPWRTSTFGTGQMLRHAAERGARSIFLGIGGSATNDGGCGMLAALGYRWIDAHGTPITPADLPQRLPEARFVDASEAITLPPLLVAADVTNPLLGEQGATRIYGPQKGITPDVFERHESRLAHLAELVEQALGVPQEAKERPGSGAAGGLGFALGSVLNARLMPGFELLAGLTSIKQAIASVDLVITGEGCFDAQSLNGKGPAGVARMARELGRPVAAMCGLLEEDAAAAADFDAAWQAKPVGMSTGEAIARAAELLADCARRNSRLLHEIIGAR